MVYVKITQSVTHAALSDQHDQRTSTVSSVSDTNLPVEMVTMANGTGTSEQTPTVATTSDNLANKAALYISTPSNLASVSRVADTIITGSALGGAVLFTVRLH